MDSIVKQLKQFKADAIYEKKKHYNAAERKRRYYRILSFIQIFLNAITGTTLLTVVFGKGSKMAEIIALILTIISTILASIQKICDYEKQAQGNAKAADMYLRISKKISLTLNFIKDKLLSEQDVMKRAEEIQSEMSQANEIGSQFPTNQGDYDKAKSGIQNGEENYTEEELDLWEQFLYIERDCKMLAKSVKKIKRAQNIKNNNTKYSNI